MPPSAAILGASLADRTVGALGHLVVADILPVIDVVFVTDVVHDAAIAALLAAGRRALSLVDCVSFETMRRHHLTAAFSYDRHFKEQGFEPV